MRASLLDQRCSQWSVCPAGLLPQGRRQLCYVQIQSRNERLQNGEWRRSAPGRAAAPATSRPTLECQSRAWQSQLGAPLHNWVQDTFACSVALAPSCRCWIRSYATCYWPAPVQQKRTPAINAPHLHQVCAGRKVHHNLHLRWLRRKWLPNQSIQLDTGGPGTTSTILEQAPMSIISSLQWGPCDY